MVVGNVIGSGIFAKPGEIAANGGDFKLILTAWVVGGGLCILGGLCFAELAAMMPRAGGMYVYLRETYGRPTAFLFGWADFLFRSPASIGALAVFFVASLEEALKPTGIAFDLWAEVMLCLVLIFGMAWVNVIGVIWGGRVQAGTTIVKAGFLGALALAPFLLILFGINEYSTTNYATTIDLSQDDRGLPVRFAAVMLAVMWAYNGWHGITPVAEEIREPQRNIPLSLFGGIGILILLYVGANLAYHGVLTMEEMQAAEKKGAHRMIEKLFSETGYAATAVAGISAVIMCSTFGAINSNLLNAPRISFAMGRDGVFFRSLGRVHVNYRTPATAIIVQAIMSAALVIVSAVLVANVEMFEKRSIFSILTDFVIFAASIFYWLSVLAVILLRRRHPEWERPYKAWGYPVTPILYLAFYVWFLYAVYLTNPFEAAAGVGLILLGVPFYVVWQRYTAKRSGEPKA